MSNEPNLEELRENARTNYGITNADDLDAETLQSEIDAIDKQASDARNEGEEADEATVDSADDGDEDEDEDVSPEDDPQAKLVDLKARATEVGVEDADAFTKKDDVRAAIKAKLAEGNDQSDEV